jgi:hypothetical protein
MRKQKPRNAFVAQDTDFTDLGVLNMTPIIAAEVNEPESEPEEEPEFDIALKILEPKTWGIRNKVIVRDP